MPRESLQFSKWLVLIEGVEIPLISHDTLHATDNIQKLTLTIEPDPVLRQLRP